MNTATAILRDLIIVKFGRDSQFELKKITDNFLNEFAQFLCNFENDVKPLYEAVYSLELADPEKYILQLQYIYSSFIDELAENHVLGNTTELSSLLINSNNKLFSDRLNYFKNLEKAIKKLERKRIKDTLSTSFESLNFEIPNNELELAIKKKAREDLRMKIKKWDSELIEENEITIFNSYNSTEKTNIFSFSWVKYSVAACLILGLGLWGIIHNIELNSEPPYAELSKLESNEIIQQIESIRIAELRTIRKKVNLNESVTLGFINKTKKIKIVINDPLARILTLNEASIVYQKLLEKEVDAKSGISRYRKNKVNAVLKEKIEFSKVELEKLNSLINQYTFDGTTLTLYTSSQIKTYPLYLKDHYYLKFKGIIYKLNITNNPQRLQKITDPSTIDSLNKILYENGI